MTRLERRQEILPRCRHQRFGGRVPIGPSDHRRFLDLFRVIRFDNVDDIEAPQGSETIFPANAGTLALDLCGYSLGQLQNDWTRNGGQVSDTAS